MLSAQSQLSQLSQLLVLVLAIGRNKWKAPHDDIWKICGDSLLISSETVLSQDKKICQGFINQLEQIVFINF